MDWIQLIVAVLTSAITSSGLWTFILKKMEKKDAKSRMLIGLAHDRIMYLGMTYIERGYITRSEYENLHDYLYLPYAEMGGNGSAKRIMDEVDKLPLRDN